MSSDQEFAQRLTSYLEAIEIDLPSDLATTLRRAPRARLIGRLSLAAAGIAVLAAAVLVFPRILPGDHHTTPTAPSQAHRFEQLGPGIAAEVPTGWSVEVAAGSVLLGHEEGSVTLLEPIALYPLKPDGSAATPQPGGSSQSFLLGRADLVDHENTFTPARLGEFPAGSLDATVRSIAGGQTPLFETEGTTITIEDGPIRIYVANASGKTLVALIQAPQASFSSFANEAESLLDTVNGL